MYNSCLGCVPLGANRADGRVNLGAAAALRVVLGLRPGVPPWPLGAHRGPIVSPLFPTCDAESEEPVLIAPATPLLRALQPQQPAEGAAPVPQQEVPLAPGEAPPAASEAGPLPDATSAEPAKEGMEATLSPTKASAAAAALERPPKPLRLGLSPGGADAVGWFQVEAERLVETLDRHQADASLRWAVASLASAASKAMQASLSLWKRPFARTASATALAICVCALSAFTGWSFVVCTGPALMPPAPRGSLLRTSVAKDPAALRFMVGCRAWQHSGVPSTPLQGLADRIAFLEGELATFRASALPGRLGADGGGVQAPPEASIGLEFRPAASRAPASASQMEETATLVGPSTAPPQLPSYIGQGGTGEPEDDLVRVGTADPALAPPPVGSLPAEQDQGPPALDLPPEQLEELYSRPEEVRRPTGSRGSPVPRRRMQVLPPWIRRRSLGPSSWTSWWIPARCWTACPPVPPHRPYGPPLPSFTSQAVSTPSFHGSNSSAASLPASPRRPW